MIMVKSFNFHYKNVQLGIFSNLKRFSKAACTVVKVYSHFTLNT